MKTALIGLLLLFSLPAALTGCGFPGGNAEREEQAEQREADTRLGERRQNQADDDDDDDDDDEQGEKSREQRLEQTDRKAADKDDD
ncbi:hypothetical protein ACN4EK_26795 [Pantanalinema rosaneae CENA516]|uniref:hypothetical protein n=1 Tax=Pantanalinema rosaneae TaxID=1620701 RepID=UPI003D701A4C